MSRVFNFTAGPSTVPEPVLEQARDELLDWNGLGMSVMELSHRGKHFMALAQACEARLRRLMDIPANYKVLFLQGGAQLQFAAVPLNLLGGARGADYVDTGSWSARAIKEGGRYCEVNVAASSREAGYSHVPAPGSWRLRDDAAYVHYCPNETIGGVEFHAVPAVGDVPLVADFSSSILSRPIDVSRYGVIYAGAQKNAGISGVTLVIVREDLLDREHPMTPTVMSYASQAEQGSMANTVPTFPWYITHLVLEWVEREGGVDEMARRAERKSALLYGAIDASNFYANPVAAPWRSRMNVPFTLADEALDATFLAEAEKAGLAGLKGHRSVGGMRASIYNAMPEAGVQALVDFMRDFERRHG